MLQQRIGQDMPHPLAEAMKPLLEKQELVNQQLSELKVSAAQPVAKLLNETSVEIIATAVRPLIGGHGDLTVVLGEDQIIVQIST